LVDATVVFPRCASYLSAASAARGAAASLAAGKKHTKYRNDINHEWRDPYLIYRLVP
jgi:hypothetical protein